MTVFLHPKILVKSKNPVLPQKHYLEDDLEEVQVRHKPKIADLALRFPLYWQPKHGRCSLNRGLIQSVDKTLMRIFEFTRNTYTSVYISNYMKIITVFISWSTRIWLIRHWIWLIRFKCVYHIPYSN